jgi:hypothetical protein
MYYWFKVYWAIFLKFWHHLSPTQYGYLLIATAVVGWFFMKGNKR